MSPNPPLMHGAVWHDELHTAHADMCVRVFTIVFKTDGLDAQLDNECLAMFPKEKTTNVHAACRESEGKRATLSSVSAAT